MLVTGCASPAWRPPITVGAPAPTVEEPASEGIVPGGDVEDAASLLADEPATGAPEAADGSFRLTESHLGIEDLAPGEGPEAAPGDQVEVHYQGRLEDGRVFDDSRERGIPIRFELGAGQVIAGWDEGIAGMRVGGRRRLVIPPTLAYGHAGSPPSIPPDAILEFEVELLAIRER